jgi:KaiC/GvpD/RAD55 family RecA-like ATPase
VSDFSPAALDYMVAHAIDPAVAEQLGVTEEAGRLVYPDGRRRSLNGTGPKVRGVSGRPLEPWVVVPSERPAIAVVCEGESDALACASALRSIEDGPLAGERIAVVSVPSTGCPPKRVVAAVAQLKADSVALIFDGDDAGRAASARITTTLLSAGIAPYTVEMPDGADLADRLAGMPAAERGRWLADTLLDFSAREDERQAAGDVARRDAAKRPAPRSLRLLTGDDLLALPEPSWLINGLVPAEGLTVLFGAPATGKSFLALDWALSVASATRWLGLDVRPGWVVYMAGEGAHGLGRRYRAWLAGHDAERVERVRFVVDGGVNLLDPRAVDHVREALAELPEPPRLLVVDTMARAMVGGDENAARDVGRFVQSVDELRGGRAALVVHHAGHERGRERGSSALVGAADARLQLSRDGRAMRVKLENEKQKDAREHLPLDLRLEPRHGSLVLSLVSPFDQAPEGLTVAEDLDQRVLDFVRSNAPASKRAVRDGVTGRNSDVDAALSRLEQRGQVRRTDKGWQPCPGVSGTLGHASPRAFSGTVPRDRGVPRRGTPSGHGLRPSDDEPCPASCPSGEAAAGTKPAHPQWSTSAQVSEHSEHGGSLADRMAGPNRWSADAADAFIRDAREVFPGSVEIEPDGQHAAHDHLSEEELPLPDRAAKGLPRRSCRCEPPGELMRDEYGDVRCRKCGHARPSGAGIA